MTARDAKRVWPFLATCVALTSCSLVEGYRQCADADPIRAAQLPGRLSETGLYADVPADQVAADVVPYQPEFQLWSDGARKRRWIWLPPGTRIDTSDMDNWSFPVGTKLWKEFERDGVRVETRLLQRIGAGPADWAAVAYLWDDDGQDAVAVPDGIENARQTPHDVPAAAECMGCHGGRRSRVLGFSAIQLARGGSAGSVTLEELSRRGLLSAPPDAGLDLTGLGAQRAALGYLHANCSHCHNQDRPPGAGGLRCFNPEKKFDFFLRAGDTGAVEQTATYRTALGAVIKRGDPGGSEALSRMSERSRLPPSMPPLASERVDDDGVRTIRTWIESL